jgi:tRNA A37 threonylcarbamoyladenosine biosynthesis protein TsaE
MRAREVVTHSAEETIELGRTLARELEPPKIVLLRGDLGAGKTTLVKGIAKGQRKRRMLPVLLSRWCMSIAERE